MEIDEALDWADGKRLDAKGSMDPCEHAKILAAAYREAIKEIRQMEGKGIEHPVILRSRISQWVLRAEKLQNEKNEIALKLLDQVSRADEAEAFLAEAQSKLQNANAKIAALEKQLSDADEALMRKGIYREEVHSLHARIQEDSNKIAALKSLILKKDEYFRTILNQAPHDSDFGIWVEKTSKYALALKETA